MTTVAAILKKPSTVLRHLDSITAAADANRDAFGFNPVGAYKEAIAKERLWVAVDRQDRYLGHLMFGGRPPQELRIFQIYVAEGGRGSGVARSLIDAISAQAEQLSCLNLRADVAKDLNNAVKFWQSVGFCALAPRRKKNSSGREVLIYYKRLSTPSLLPTDELPLSIRSNLNDRAVDTYVIDLNIFISLMKKRTDEQLIAQIIQAALAGEFSLFVTPEFHEELKRAKKDPDPLFHLAERTLPVLDRIASDEFEEIQQRVRAIVFPNRSVSRKGAIQDASDLRHITHCIQNGISGFITCETALLRARCQLHKEFGLSMYSLQDFKIEYIANAQLVPLDVPFAAKEGSIRVLPMKSVTQVKGFLDSLGQSFTDVAPVILKNSGRGVRDRKIVTATDQLCGVYMAQTIGAKHDILEGFFLSSSDLVSRVIVFQHLLECFLRHSQHIKAKSITFHIRSEDFDLESVCLERGFQRASASSFPGMITLIKIPCPPVVTKSNWLEFRTSFTAHTNVELPRLIPPFNSDTGGILTIQAAMNGRGYNAELFKLETLLSPSIVMLPRRTGVILPITPNFASDLLSRPDDLLPFPLEEEALLRLEKAYFRKPSHSNLFSIGTPVAFYESQSGRGVIGCGRITSVRVTSCDNALKLYRNYGVLNEVLLAAYADKKGQVQVITFDNFKQFSRPVSMNRLRELGSAKANLVGPEMLSHDQLCRILHEGMGIPFRDVLLSIQPDYVGKVLSGKKTVELRKKPFPSDDGTRVWIYSTNPTSAVEAMAYVDTVECDTPANIWRKYQHKCAVSRTDFDAYFSGATEAYALNIVRPMKLERRLRLEEIKALSEGFTPPQYYRFVDHDTKLFDALISMGSVGAS